MGLVYHYASSQGALGILQNKTLWFTDCEFMNDPGKLAYCYELYDRAWVEVCRELGVPEAQIEHEITRFANPYECRAELGDELGFDIPARYYSFSTSFEADSVAVWSNYASNGSQAGYALGLNFGALENGLLRISESVATHGMIVEVSAGKVIYDRGEQLATLKTLIKDYLAMRDGILLSNTDAIDRVMANEVSQDCHWSQICSIAPFIKRPGFEYEQEYRFVLKVAQLEPGQKAMFAPDKYAVSEQVGPRRCSDCPVFAMSPIRLCFREGFAGAITPYFEVRLGDEWVDMLSVLRVKSYAAPDLMIDGMVQLAEELGYKGLSIEVSNSSLRG